MPRIFNSIRQRLLKENRLTRYLVYAVGEILLVVIGILIALQINNWNGAQADRRMEHTLMVSMIEDLRTDTANLSFIIERYDRMELRLDTVLALYPHLGNGYNDTLWRNLPQVTNYLDFVQTDRTMQQLKNAGGMRFIESRKAVDAIIAYDASVRRLLTSMMPDLNFYYERSNEMWFELIDATALEADTRQLGISAMVQGNKHYLLKTDPASLGKFNNIIRHFDGDVVLINAKFRELRTQATELIGLLKVEYRTQ